MSRRTAGDLRPEPLHASRDLARRVLSDRISGVTTSQPDELDAIAAALAAAGYATRAIDGADGTIWRVGP
jgi:hypothetical protein